MYYQQTELFTYFDGENSTFNDTSSLPRIYVFIAIIAGIVVIKLLSQFSI